uniref:SLBP_RNA_bind domain-containing protein n=1 Tax=Macrostomum lignano TaxID=282301 RepID=A0A1I8FCS9_9PLAT
LLRRARSDVTTRHAAAPPIVCGRAPGQPVGHGPGTPSGRLVLKKAFQKRVILRSVRAMSVADALIKSKSCAADGGENHRQGELGATRCFFVEDGEVTNHLPSRWTGARGGDLRGLAKAATSASWPLLTKQRLEPPASYACGGRCKVAVLDVGFVSNRLRLRSGESPVCLPVLRSAPGLAAPACSENPPAGRNCSAAASCHDRIVLDNSGERSSLEHSCSMVKGVPNWIRVELASLRLSCPKRCGSTGLRLSELGRHFGGQLRQDGGRLRPCRLRQGRELAEQHDSECPFKASGMSSLQEADAEQRLDGAHHGESSVPRFRAEIGQKTVHEAQCNKDVLEHYRQLREHSLVTMQEFRRTELCHLERMGVQGFARRQPLPHLTRGRQLEQLRRYMKRWRTLQAGLQLRFQSRDPPAGGTEGDSNWAAGSLRLACGKPSHTPGCILSAHREFLPPLLSATRRQQQHQIYRSR